MATKIKETDMFEPIKKYFLDRDCEVYSEVLHRSKRADIVVKQGNIITVIEMKTTLSMDLLEQANGWLYYAHYVYIAVPRNKKGDINEYAKKCLRRDGIGILQVDFRDRYYYRESGPHVNEALSPKLCRKIKNYWNKCLTEEHKNTLPGGSRGGGYITPYRTTIKGVQRCLKYHPEGVSLDDLVKLVDTHYSNPKQGLYNALTNFETDWCEAFIFNRKKYFKIKEGVILDEQKRHI